MLNLDWEKDDKRPMSIVNPLASANLFIQPSTTPVPTSEERQVDLRPEQMVRAIVVEGGVDRALLEMNQRHYRAESAVELQVGQKLTLQVLQTHPTLEFRVVNDPLGGRLSQLLPLLTQPYDWAKLLDGMRQHPQPQNLPPTTVQVYQQLQHLLQPNGLLPGTLKTDLGQLPVQLQQLSLAIVNGQVGAGQAHRVPSGQQPLPELPQLMRALQVQLNQLQLTGSRPLPQAWVAETQQLLASLHLQLPQLQAQPLQLNNLFALLGQMRQQPSLPPQFTGELERLILQLAVPGDRSSAALGRPMVQVLPQPAVVPPASNSLSPGQTAQGASSPAAQPSQGGGAAQFSPQWHAPPEVSAQAVKSEIQPAGVYRPPMMSPPIAQASQPAPVVPAEISAGLDRVLAQVQQAQEQTGKLSPDLLGRLEGLLDKLQQLPPVVQSAPPLLPGLEMITSQLTQLVQQGPQQPEGGQLGFLSQLFGFHLEAELLKGKKKEALASLKLGLLAMQKDLGERVEEPLRRLEMFQLCKARLAEEQVQFLPLPFNELEEGYLLMENPPQEEEPGGDEQAMQLSLSLRLTALGNMRVDMLYDKKGLHLRMACEDKEKMAYLQNHSAELEDALGSVSLCGVSFSADAQIPARQLLERLLPDAFSMLDDRI